MTPECPKCGCIKIGNGKIKGHGGQVYLQPEGKLISKMSGISVQVCTNCGYIIGLYTDLPEIFKDNS